VRRRPALLSALTAAALVAVALTGCAPAARGAGNQPAGCTPALPTGDASSTVTATGAVGKSVKASFPTPLAGTASQVTVLHDGHGTAAPVGGFVKIEYTAYNGQTGKSLGGTGYDASKAVTYAAGRPIQGQKTTLTSALVCAQSGARLALTTTAKAGFGKGSLAQYGIADTGTIVLVIDVVATYLGKADGVNQLPKDGMPNVITAVDGQPGIVIQELNKPTTARSETVKAGGGATLKKDDKAVVLYTAWTWPASGEKPAVVTDLDAWSSHAATTLQLTPISKGGPLPTAFVNALIGQKVGSQVLIVLPPKDGFPADQEPSSSLTAKDTVVFVVDVLGIDD
jgi:hypothetical protein